MAAGMAAAPAQFAASYDRAAVWQGGSAILTIAAGAATAIIEQDWLWLVAAGATGAAVPWTLIVILPALHALHDGGRTEQAALATFRRWEKLHHVRSVLGAAGLVAAIIAAIT
jgi:hypothetical protein